MNISIFRFGIIFLISSLFETLRSQELYIGVGYSSMNPKSTYQSIFYRETNTPRLESEFSINAQYEIKLIPNLGLSFHAGYVRNTNKNVFWIDPKYFPQLDPGEAVLRYSFNNVSHLISTGVSTNWKLIKFENLDLGIAPYFRANFLFKKQTQPAELDDFKFATHKFKPFNLEAYPLLFGKINRFLIQVGPRVYSIKYFDEVVELTPANPNSKIDYSNAFKWVANISFRL